MDSRQRNDAIKVVMLPWLAHGHISPFLELAKRLTTRNFHTFLCSTPETLKSVKPKLSEKYFKSIELVELHLPDDELPPHYHTTKGLPSHLIPTLQKAFDIASPNLSNILKTLSPDLLIYDMLAPWAPSVALSQKVAAIGFSPTGAATISLALHFMNNPSAEYPFQAMFLRDYEMNALIKRLESSSNTIGHEDRLGQCILRSCSIVLIKTFREIEGKYVDYLSHLGGKMFLPVGPLVDEDDNVVQEDNGKSNVIEWLNKREKASVVYVSFGSEYFLSKKEIEEIAHGLELSKVGYIWVIRFPAGEKTGVEEVLPEGFVDRVGKKGVIVEGWAPQTKILQHSSVGGFVSHCGWSSVMESIRFGVPIIAMPMQLDQPLNARLVVEVGVGIEAERTGDGSLQREAVAKAITDVVEKNGESVRRRAMEIRDNLKKKEEEIDEVVQLIKSVVLAS